MMNSFIRWGAGILGSAFALLMYGAPLSTFRRVIKKGTTEDMSGIPYAIGLFNCLVYTLYGSPLISDGWDHALVMATNATGFLLECLFVAIYLFFAPSKSKKTMSAMIIGVLMVFASTAIVSLWAVHDHVHKRFLVGTTGMVATVFLYGSPLSDIRMVLRTKSVEFMSFYFSLFAFLGSVLWLVYGAFSRDILIMAPNFLGIPFSSVQMIIYFVYKRKGRQLEVVDGKVHIQIDDVKDKGAGTMKCAPSPRQNQTDTTDIEMQLKQAIA